MSVFDIFASKSQRQEAMDAAYLARRDLGDQAEAYLLDRLSRTTSGRRRQVYRIALRIMKER